ncbi:MAG TPA: glycogen synthase GlgA [Nitrospira sp.]|nr:glycogen synthase GlgA [Nitrospira sp.]
MRKSRPLKLVIAASEAIPYAKTGGLADVAGALPREFAKLGHDVILITPRYRKLDQSGRTFRPLVTLPIDTPRGVLPAVIEEDVVSLGDGQDAFRVWAIGNDPYFDRPGLYQEAGADYPDNLDRFAFFSRAIIETIAYLTRERAWRTDLLHLHDWQTALCAVYVKTNDVARAEVSGTKTVLTIHNAGYQGIFPGAQFSKTGLASSLFAPIGLEFYGSVNLLKGGIIYSDYITTVSPTYAKEILTPELGFGLEGVLLHRQAQFEGILNGIDIDLWNPATDPHLAATYTAVNRENKRVCKKTLRREFNLPDTDDPLIVVIGRMASQKGFDLIEEAIPGLMKMGLQLVVLGTGDPDMEGRFQALQARFPKQIGLRIGFDEALAHRIEGGGDMLVMPSRYEPCGLSQLYSLRYGTVPIVRKTGGLADTVVPFTPQKPNTDQATGFHITEHTAQSLLSAVRDAVSVFSRTTVWNKLVDNAMGVDVSWAHSARHYDRLFESLVQ